MQVVHLMSIQYFFQYGEKAERALDGVLCLLAAESISARGLKPPLISSAELQVKKK